MSVRPFGELLEQPMRSGFTVPAASRGSGIKMLNMGELFRYPRIPDVDMVRVEVDPTREDRNLLRKGDLMFARRSLTLEGAGKCAIVHEVAEPTTWESSIIRARVDHSVGLPDFYFYYFASPQGRRQIETIVEQVAAAGIRLSELRGLEVPWPELHEQRAIAEVLGALDDKIAANTRLIEIADGLASARTRAALTDERVDLSSMADITMGSSPPGSSYNENQDGVVFYQGVRDFGVRFPTNRVWTTEPVRMAEPGDTLLSVRAPVGRTNLAAEPTCIGRGLAAVRSMTGHPMTMFHVLRDDHAAWAPYEAEGTVFGSINKKQLASLQIASVAPGQSVELERVLSALEQRIAAAIAESEQLAKTRDALLPLLMSGRVTVKDAESVVEGVA